MKIEIKKLHPNAVIPHHATEGSAGLDLTAVDIVYEENYIEYKTGISVKIPDGYVGFLFQRSSVSKQPKGFILRNAVGVLDSDYLGEITFRYSYPKGFKFSKINDKTLAVNNLKAYDLLEETYKVKDRIGQLVVVPYVTVEFTEVDELPETKRGDAGYGSTGR